MVAEKWGIATDGSEKMLETRPSIDRIRIRTKFAEIPASMWPRLFDRGRSDRVTPSGARIPARVCERWQRSIQFSRYSTSSPLRNPLRRFTLAARECRPGF